MTRDKFGTVGNNTELVTLLCNSLLLEVAEKLQLYFSVTSFYELEYKWEPIWYYKSLPFICYVTSVDCFD